MTPDDVTVFPIPGQFWAFTKPLALAQCLVGGEEIIHFKAWYPTVFRDETDPLIYVAPLNDAKYLWYQRVLTPEIAERVFPSVPFAGDVWALQELKPKLFFVGPRVSGDVMVIANWDMDEVLKTVAERGMLLTRLFQAGPGRGLPVPIEPATAVDRLLGGRELV